jgi:hypothetical protein
MNSALTGSAPDSITIGIVVVVCFAAAIAGVVGAIIRSTFEPTSSVASEGKRLEFPFRISILDDQVFSFGISDLPLNLGTKPQCYDVQAQTEAEEIQAISNQHERLSSAAGLERGRVSFELNR